MSEDTMETKQEIKRRGAPVLPQEEKRIARCTLRFSMEDFYRHEKFCKEHGIKVAEFYRFAAREYIASGTTGTQVTASENEKVYILNMMQTEKAACEEFAKTYNMSLADFFRVAAEEYIDKYK